MDNIYYSNDIYEGVDRMIQLELSCIILTNQVQYQRMLLENRYFYDEPITMVGLDGIGFYYAYKGQKYYIYTTGLDDNGYPVFKARRVVN